MGHHAVQPSVLASVLDLLVHVLCSMCVCMYLYVMR